MRVSDIFTSGMVSTDRDGHGRDHDRDNRDRHHGGNWDYDWDERHWYYRWNR